MAFVAALVGLTLAHVVFSQARYNFDIRQPAPAFVGGANQPVDGLFPGLPVFRKFRSGQPESGGNLGGQTVVSPDESGPRVVSSFPGAVPVATRSRTAPSLFPDANGSGSVIKAVNGRVIALPPQQGSSIVGGQGTSFVSGGSFNDDVIIDGQFEDGRVTSGTPNIGVFSRSIITQPFTPTVTQTSTVDDFQTSTDLVLHSVPVTHTLFTLLTTTQQTTLVVPTPVGDYMSLSTTVVASPTFLTITETKSDFRVAIRTSISYVTLTHTVYSILNIPYTVAATQTVRVTSPMVKTVIDTSFTTVTNVRTVAHTVFVHGGYSTVDRTQ